MKERKIGSLNLLIYILVIIDIILIIVFARRFLGAFYEEEPQVITSSTLTNAIDISELSTSQFTYNGIAELYKDESHQKIMCYIRYNATIKAGIDMKDVKFDVDEASKTVTVTLPSIKITSSPVDEKTLSFIPSNPKAELSTILTTCKEDAEREASESGELLDAAEENLKSIIEGLLTPILSPQGYKIIWK